MSQPISVLKADEHRPPTQRLMSITSGPMSEGMIPSVSTTKQMRQRSNSTEHVCLFSVCLMFMGVPIIVIGILTLTILTPFAVIMLMIGVVASVSGAVLVLLTGLISLFTRRSTPSTAPADYGDDQTPEIIIEDTLYTESFDDNLCEEQPEQLSVSGLADLPSMEKLDPVQWSNYPEAQNPKSYLQSFGDLPKVLPSPDIRPTSASKRKPLNKKSKSKGKSIGRKFSKIRGMSAKRKTISRTSLTHEYSDEIVSSSLSSTSSGRSSPVEQNNRGSYLRIKADTFEVNNNNQSIVTIENMGPNTDDCNEEEVLSSSVDNNYDDCNQTNDETDDKSIANYSYNEHKANGVLPDNYTDSIELTERTDRNEKDTKYDKSETWVEAQDYSDLWNSKPSAKKS